MSDADREIVRLLTEIRDEQRAEAAYRRQYLDESAVQNREAMELQKRAVRAQRRGGWVAVGFLVVAAVAGGMALFYRPAAREQPPPAPVVVPDPGWPGGGPGQFRFRPPQQPPAGAAAQAVAGRPAAA